MFRFPQNHADDTTFAFDTTSAFDKSHRFTRYESNCNCQPVSLDQVRIVFCVINAHSNFKLSFTIQTTESSTTRIASQSSVSTFLGNIESPRLDDEKIIWKDPAGDEGFDQFNILFGGNRLHCRYVILRHFHNTSISKPIKANSVLRQQQDSPCSKEATTVNTQSNEVPIKDIQIRQNSTNLWKQSNSVSSVQTPHNSTTSVTMFDDDENNYQEITESKNNGTNHILVTINQFPVERPDPVRTNGHTICYLDSNVLILSFLIHLELQCYIANV